MPTAVIIFNGVNWLLKFNYKVAIGKILYVIFA